MKFTNNGKVFLLAAASSLLIPFLVVVRSSFPYLGLGLSLIIVASLVYFFKHKKGPKTKIFYFFTLLFSVFIFIRSEFLITFLNLLAALFFGSLMTFPKKAQNLFDAAFSPISTIIKSLATKNIYQLEYENNERPKVKSQIPDILIGIAITVLVLSIILPLLSSVNPIFNKMLTEIIKNLNLQNLANWFNMENLFVNLVRLSISLFLVILIPKMISASNNKSGENTPFELKINFIIPKVAVLLVLTLFFITQFQLYFSSSETLTQMGYSYSQYTREVFGQLSLVSLIVFLLVYLDKSQSKLSRLINYILLIQTGFLTFMAFKSVYEYSAKWGLTYLRLYGFSVVAWTLGALYLFIDSINKHSKKSFIPKTIIWTGIVLAFVNLSNFDYLIYHFRKASTGQGIDHQYLSRLSSDSFSFKEQLEDIKNQVPATFKSKEDTDKYWIIISPAGNRLDIKIDLLKIKYDKFDPRTFNLLDYIAYLRVKDLDLSPYREAFNKPVPVY